jgi:hypothetical protein
MNFGAWNSEFLVAEQRNLGRPAHSFRIPAKVASAGDFADDHARLPVLAVAAAQKQS